ncbi:hypothetical protein CSV71_10480 [Sporosarcina sp. P21c]|uniref:hypothetical protein n=1 Tax=unclassified Sporosarcina TaxID=2647733 RepID=UPI000C173888|nr:MULTISPECIES: hypothetical protein [unclassified Sporosarcina]PIC67615.1 hypothetical protein CSV78_06835 [Sporosarcina sp. P16a]PIC83584.1 hypothetical protein CSV73_06675 [Sporosarcina sp. P1]PIC89339.1 hypothetical protein CSV71_10480 [Sporosarcina sp. P21c]PIC93066.1 hypothetical protein CSV70_07585 [Sporosarcina sp. P25]
MDWDALFEVLRNIFMILFIMFFVIDVFSKRSYKVLYHIALTVGVTFSTFIWNWSIGFKVGFIALFLIVAVKTISDVRKSEIDTNTAA